MFQKACDLAPQDPNLKLSYAIALERALKFAESMEVINEVISLAPNDPRARAALKRVKSFKPAISEISATVECDPHALSNLGKQQFAVRKFEDAAATFRTLVGHYPNWARAHQHLGASLLELGLLDQAVDSLRTAVALDPEMSKARFLLGRALLRQGKYKEAEQELRESILINPQFEPAQEELRHAVEAREIQQRQADELARELGR